MAAQKKQKNRNANPPAPGEQAHLGRVVLKGNPSQAQTSPLPLCEILFLFSSPNRSQENANQRRKEKKKGKGSRREIYHESRHHAGERAVEPCEEGLSSEV
jgi:hypothetical protein